MSWCEQNLFTYHRFQMPSCAKHSGANLFNTFGVTQTLVTLLVCTWHDTSLSESFYIWLTDSVALSKKKKKGILPSFVHYHLFYPLCTVLASAISQYTTLLLFSSIHNKCSQLDFLSTSSLFSIILCPLHSFSVYKVLLPSFIVLCCSCYHHVSM